ncbi:MAG: PRD domain-containing protein [Erysipelotrichaceae bacterium]|nr:PRD domain-containing protein [Erysipelotrichaceae bacterium]
MRIIKKINNNFALAQDDQGRNLVAYGKGIGFPTMPYVLTDLSKIDRTFYDVQREHLPMFYHADEKVIALAMDIVDYVRLHVNAEIGDYLYYVLVDHINFAIERYKNNEYVPMKLSRDIRYNYAKEYDAGKWAWKYINKKMNLRLPKDEATIIAMHIVESEQSTQKSQREISIDEIIDEVMKIVSSDLGIEIRENEFNIYRFETHVRYLIQRIDDQEMGSKNMEIYESVVEKYPDAHKCALNVSQYLNKTLGRAITREEILYLILHINRLSDRT